MIGIIGAMDEEVAILKESMEVQDTMERAGMTFVKGIMSGKEVVVVRSGIGKVNMGICAQILIDCFGVDTLINTGVAGSLDADINIGDIDRSTFILIQGSMDILVEQSAVIKSLTITIGCKLPRWSSWRLPLIRPNRLEGTCSRHIHFCLCFIHIAFET